MSLDECFVHARDVHSFVVSNDRFRDVRGIVDMLALNQQHKALHVSVSEKSSLDSYTVPNFAAVGALQAIEFSHWLAKTR